MRLIANRHKKKKNRREKKRGNGGKGTRGEKSRERTRRQIYIDREKYRDRGGKKRCVT